MARSSSVSTPSSDGLNRCATGVVAMAATQSRRITSRRHAEGIGRRVFLGSQLRPGVLVEVLAHGLHRRIGVHAVEHDHHVGIGARLQRPADRVEQFPGDVTCLKPTAARPGPDQGEREQRTLALERRGGNPSGLDDEPPRPLEVTADVGAERPGVRRPGLIVPLDTRTVASPLPAPVVDGRDRGRRPRVG